jgi:hypothetical protein
MYLGGGTAVALHLGHRQSIDLDWFSEQPLVNPMRLAQELRDSGIEFVTTSVERGTLHGTHAGVRVSFPEYRYPVLKPPHQWSNYGCAVAAIEDLAAMKMLAVAQRGSRKDFLDVYALGERLPLTEMLRLYQEKFSVEDISRVLYGLCYFGDADHEPMPRLLADTDWDCVKRTIQDRVKELAG